MIPVHPARKAMPMKQKLTLRRVLASAVAALAAAAAVWLLCRWVGYDLQLRIGNEPVYEIANDDYTQTVSYTHLPRTLDWYCFWRSDMIWRVIMARQR